MFFEKFDVLIFDLFCVKNICNWKLGVEIINYYNWVLIFLNEGLVYDLGKVGIFDILCV